MEPERYELVRHLIYRVFATEGRAPSVGELARRSGTDVEETTRTLRGLADRHAIVLAPDGDAIRMAHPFSSAPMAFVVTPLDGHDDRRWWGGCAWDSLGISAALDLDVRIDTACPSCGAALQLTAGPRRPPRPEPVVRFPAPASAWWNDVVATCTAIRLFCDRDHARGWVETHDGAAGRLVGVRRVWELARPWYGDRLDPDHLPHTRQHNQALLTAHGLVGSFWELP